MATLGGNSSGLELGPPRGVGATERQEGVRGRRAGGGVGRWGDECAAGEAQHPAQGGPPGKERLLEERGRRYLIGE